MAKRDDNTDLLIAGSDASADVPGVEAPPGTKRAPVIANYNPEEKFYEFMGKWGPIVNREPGRWWFDIYRDLPRHDPSGAEINGRVARVLQAFDLEYLERFGPGMYHVSVMGPELEDPDSPVKFRGQAMSLRVAPKLGVDPMQPQPLTPPMSAPPQPQYAAPIQYPQPPPPPPPQMPQAEEDDEDDYIPPGRAPSWMRQPYEYARPWAPWQQEAPRYAPPPPQPAAPPPPPPPPPVDAVRLAEVMSGNSSQVMASLLDSMSKRPDGQSEEAKRLHELVSQLQREIEKARSSAVQEVSSLREAQLRERADMQAQHFRELNETRERHGEALDAERKRSSDIQNQLTLQHTQHVEMMRQSLETKVSTLTEQLIEAKRQADDSRREIESLKGELHRSKEALFTAQIDARLSAAAGTATKSNGSELESFAKTFTAMKAIATEIIPGGGAAAAAAPAEEGGLLAKGLDVAKSAFESEGLKNLFGAVATRVQAATQQPPQAPQPTPPPPAAPSAPPAMVEQGVNAFNAFRNSLPTAIPKPQALPAQQPPPEAPVQEPPSPGDALLDMIEDAAAEDPGGANVAAFSEAFLAKLGEAQQMDPGILRTLVKTTPPAELASFLAPSAAQLTIAARIYLDRGIAHIRSN